jgi:hypothetical protein
VILEPVGYEPDVFWARIDALAETEFSAPLAHLKLHAAFSAEQGLIR